LKKIEKSKLLIVEGNDEEEIFNYWLKQLNLNEIQVLAIGGKSNLTTSLELLKNDSNFNLVSNIGIIRDADEDLTSAFRSVNSSLRNNKLIPPNDQKIYSTGNPKVKVLIASNDKNKGSIESYFVNSILATKEMPCVNKFFECIKNVVGTTPNENKIDVAKTYVYLAANPSYCRMRLSHSVLAGHWDLTHTAFKDLESFLKTI